MEPKITNKVSKAIEMPDAFVILFFVVCLAWLMTYFLPAGSFDVIENSSGKQQISAETYQQQAEAEGLPLFAANGEMGLINYAFEGMVSGDRMGSAIGVIMFILVIGGAFGIIMETQAVNNGILALINKTKRLEVVLLPLMFVLFSLAGAVFGMGEEAIAFCIVLYPLVLALGYDAITTVMITYVATQIGFATSWMNPFSVAVAQGLAEVPVLSGAPFRMTMWFVFTLVGVLFTLSYAKKIKNDPRQSLTFELDQKQLSSQKNNDQQELSVAFNMTDKLILLAFAAGVTWVIWGVIAKGYYIPEIATQFFAIGIVIGVIAVIRSRMSMNDVSKAFQHGAQSLLPAALIVGMAKGILLLLGGDDPTEPSVLNTILYGMGQLIGDASESVSAVLMLMLQSIFNFFVASGSGQAALTMPLMAPLSDIVGVSRQVAVLAFQLGDGLTNLIIPTSASLIGCLGVVKVDWVTWVKFVWKFQLVLTAMAIASMLIAVQYGLT
ncbi:MAG: putative basic amino acid antiporter YfcC [Gammaproteobacteria bacterium]|nr:putative basic amino acid antiporter YfcC [Gammaproteobacteria bacterium]